MAALVPPRRPSLPLRAAAGAWHVPAGFGFLLRRPGLWPLAALPVVLAVVLVFLGLVLGVFAGARVEARFAPAPGSLPVFVELPVGLLLWTATLGSGVFLGLGIALVLASPILDQLSRQVEAQARGRVGDSGKGLRWEAGQAVRGSLYFLAAAPGVFLLGLVPIVGPFLSLAWGGRAVAFQMTDPALSRRGPVLPGEAGMAPRVAGREHGLRPRRDGGPPGALRQPPPGPRARRGRDAARPRPRGRGRGPPPAGRAGGGSRPVA